MVGAGVGTGEGGISQSFLVSNRFSDANPALGQGAPCLTGALGISSSNGGLSFRDLFVVFGTSANCPMASLCSVISIDSAVDLTTGVCVLTVATMGVVAVEVEVEGVGWVSALTLYLLFGYHGFSSFVCDICFGSWGFPDSGVGAWLGWSWLVWLHMGLVHLGVGLGPGLGIKSSFPF